MNEQDIIQFYNTNSKEDTKAYLNQLIQNIKDITHTSYKHFIYLILIILVYYLIEESKLNSIGLGIIQISDIKIIKILIPPLFAINHLVVYLGMFRRQKLEFQTKELMNLIYQTPKQQKQLTRYSLNDFNLSYFPFYIFSEINYIIITLVHDKTIIN